MRVLYAVAMDLSALGTCGNAGEEEDMGMCRLDEMAAIKYDACRMAQRIGFKRVLCP